MANLKTTQTDANVDAYIEAIADETAPRRLPRTREADE